MILNFLDIRPDENAVDSLTSLQRINVLVLNHAIAIADLLVSAAAHTFAVPLMISFSKNNKLVVIVYPLLILIDQANQNHCRQICVLA